LCNPIETLNRNPKRVCVVSITVKFVIDDIKSKIEDTNLKIEHEPIEKDDNKNISDNYAHCNIIINKDDNAFLKKVALAFEKSCIVEVTRLQN